MNYFPYFRGKQYELICLRENAKLIAKQGYTPIIEPVKEGAGGLLRAIEALKGEGAKFLIVANPSVGHHAGVLPDEFRDEVIKEIGDYEGGRWIFQAGEPADLGALSNWLKTFLGTAILHLGTGSVAPKDVVAVSSENEDASRIHVFGEKCSSRYRNAFSGNQRVLLMDGFNKQKNADYPEVEMFSELPVTYQDEGMQGFGDYLIVGNEFAEGGGAAYAVAIHITYSDPDDDGVIYIRHFISDTNATPTDPAGKFREALAKLVKFRLTNSSKIPRTLAIQEFERLDESGHFPGLGYVKKLSMQHHLEIMGG